MPSESSAAVPRAGRGAKARIEPPRGQTMSNKATPKVQVDNDRVRVTEWRFSPGAATGWHRHGMDYVVVPGTTGKLRLVDAEGEREAELVAGVSYFRSAGVEHDVINANDHPFVFVEIELKT
jgi:quercetin dioxygenase-like cupin family protein